MLYPETEPLAIPDVSSPSCVYKMASLCIWMQIRRKALAVPNDIKNRLIVKRELPAALVAANE